VESTRRGWFITLEGPDGAGKSVAAAHLAANLRAAGRHVTATREPGGTRLGERVRAIVLDLDADRNPSTPEAEALLFNAARAQHVREVIAPALARGDVVVCDRFAASTMAYQGYGGGVSLDALRQVERLSIGETRPDLVLLLDIPVEVGLARRDRGDPRQITRFEEESLYDAAFHRRVRAGFLAQADADAKHWRVVDGDRPAEQVSAEIARICHEFLAARDPLPSIARMQG
jgi:dTMP kinase